MKVMYVTIQFPAPTETFATNEVRMLVQRGASISVHCLRAEHRDAARLASDRGVERVPTTHNSARSFARGVLHSIRRPRLAAGTVRWLLRSTRRQPRDMFASLAILPRAFDILAEVERERPHVVHMYWGHFPALVGRLVQQRLPEIVTSLSMVAYDLTREYGAVIDVARRADVVRTHANVNRDHVARFTGVDREAVNVVYNGIDVAWLDAAKEGCPRVRHRVFAAGKLTPNKGMGNVVQAFSAVHERWPNATLVIAGDGPQRADIEAECRRAGIEASVRLLGHVDHARVIREMAMAEVFLLLSSAPGERLPNVVKEGMASGCVCITTPTPGIEELLQDGVTGYVVDAADVTRVADIVDRVFSGSVDVDTITVAARRHIERSFDLASTAPRYLTLWRDAIGRRSSVRD